MTEKFQLSDEQREVMKELAVTSKLKYDSINELLNENSSDAKQNLNQYRDRRKKLMKRARDLNIPSIVIMDIDLKVCPEDKRQTTLDGVRFYSTLGEEDIEYLRKKYNLI